MSSYPCDSSSNVKKHEKPNNGKKKRQLSWALLLYAIEKGASLTLSKRVVEFAPMMADHLHHADNLNLCMLDQDFGLNVSQIPTFSLIKQI